MPQSQTRAGYHEEETHTPPHTHTGKQGNHVTLTKNYSKPVLKGS